MDGRVRPLRDQLIIAAAVTRIARRLHIRRKAVRNKAERVRKRTLSRTARADDRHHIIQIFARLIAEQAPHFNIFQRTVILNPNTKNLSHEKSPPIACLQPASCATKSKGNPAFSGIHWIAPQAARPAAAIPMIWTKSHNHIP